MYCLTSKIAPGYLGEAKPGALAGMPKHLVSDIYPVKATARPTPHYDSYCTPCRVTTRPSSRHYGQASLLPGANLVRSRGER